MLNDVFLLTEKWVTPVFSLASPNVNIVMCLLSVAVGFLLWLSEDRFSGLGPASSDVRMAGYLACLLTLFYSSVSIALYIMADELHFSA